MKTYTIAEISRDSNLTASTLRYYEEIGLLKDVQRNNSKQRVYTQEHVNQLNAIACFKNTGMSISDIRNFFEYETDEKAHIDEIMNLLVKFQEKSAIKIRKEIASYAHLLHKIDFYQTVRESFFNQTDHPHWEDFQDNDYLEQAMDVRELSITENKYRRNAMSEIIIRQEQEKDYEKAEELVREAFWDVYEPGCTEPYMLHVMRKHPDFLKELDLVAELDGKIVGQIAYAKSKLIDENGNEKEVLGFGPISIHPDYQRKGIGKKLQETSFQKGREMGYDYVVIFGNPGNYLTTGFKSCKKYNICLEDGVYPTAMLVNELVPNALDGRKWFYRESKAGYFNRQEAENFDKKFPPREKGYKPTQEEFFIYSHSVIRQ